ncbi:hypothetical protein [Sandaracinus amylolyticus]|uniref:hypothetical protein n=1 Tax=Sandaracinus amylolyticus TaxID=927083 RepID=UPI001F4747EA|nr:hypothetical protein [Sandaracinus amylolyticus]
MAESDFRSTNEHGTVVVEWPRGYAQHRSLAPGACFLRIGGHALEGLLPFHWKFLEPHVGARSGLTVIIDLTDLQTYDSGYRAGWTQWLREHPAQIHLYSPSRMVRMGAAVVHLATDKITAYDSLGALYAFASKSVPGFAASSIPAPRAARAFG